MIVLRVLCFIVGLFVLIVTPFVLLPQTTHGVFAGTEEVVLAGAGIVVFAAGFFYLAVAGYRASRSLPLRLMAAGFAGFQSLAGVWVIFHYDAAEVMLMVAPLLGLALFATFSFVWPAARNRAYRPLRRREDVDQLISR